MSIKKQILGVAAAAALAAGALFAQQAQQPPKPRGEHMQQFLAEQLNLTEAQKTQAQTIFDQAKTQAKPVADQLRQGRDQMIQAIKAGKSDAELQQIADQQGQLMAQVSGIRAKAFAKFYTLLTPDQKTKADSLYEQFRGMMGRRFGPARAHTRG